MKICKKCSTYKQLDEFSKDKQSKDGLDYYCKKCRYKNYKSRNYDRKAYQLAYKRKDIEKRKIYLKDYMKNYRKGYYHKTKEKYKWDRKIISMLKSVLKRKGYRKNTKTSTLLGWSKDEFIAKFPVIPNEYQLDHKIPISWFTESTPIYVVNSLDNLHFIPATVNLSKGNKYAHSISVDYFNLIIGYLKPKYKDYSFITYPVNLYHKIC